MPESVVNFSLRSRGEANLAFVLAILGSKCDSAKADGQAPPLHHKNHNLRALRNEVRAKNTNNRATATAIPMSQPATSRVQARKAALSQPSARTAKNAAMTS